MRENGQDIQFENDVSQEILSEQEIKLPTSPEIAQKGMESFKNILDKLPPKLQQPLLEWERYHKNLLGIEPWISIAKVGYLTEEEQDQIDEAIDSDPNFHVVPYYETRSNGELLKHRAIYNVLAIKNIARDYPQFFDSETIDSSRDWLNNWPEPSLITIKKYDQP